ncbi:hypothetical protein VTO73DRAFT_14542 [Trametes versicolor]
MDFINDLAVRHSLDTAESQAQHTIVSARSCAFDDQVPRYVAIVCAEASWLDLLDEDPKMVRPCASSAHDLRASETWRIARKATPSRDHPQAVRRPISPVRKPTEPTPARPHLAWVLFSTVTSACVRAEAEFRLTRDAATDLFDLKVLRSSWSRVSGGGASTDSGNFWLVNHCQAQVQDTSNCA